MTIPEDVKREEDVPTFVHFLFRYPVVCITAGVIFIAGVAIVRVVQGFHARAQKNRRNRMSRSSNYGIDQLIERVKHYPSSYLVYNPDGASWSFTHEDLEPPTLLNNRYRHAENEWAQRLAEANGQRYDLQLDPYWYQQGHKPPVNQVEREMQEIVNAHWTD